MLVHGRRAWAAALIAVLALATFGPTGAAAAVPFSATVTFEEYAFPQATTDAGIVVNNQAGTETTRAVNLFDDTTGAALAADNGDRADLVFTFRLSPSDLEPTNRPDLRFRRSGAGVQQLTGRHAFSDPPTTNNPGTREWYEVEVRVADHLQLTDIRLDLFSLNTAGTTWEFSEITYLAADGAPFGPRPEVPPYLEAVPGLAGSPAPGSWLASLTSTVEGVGTSLTSGGTSHPPADGPTIVDAASVGLSGERVGGFVWRTTLEDVAGTDNAATSFSSSLRSIELTGELVPPAPDLVVSKAAAPTTVTVGDEVVYTLAVENVGTAAASDVVLTDPLDASLAYLSDTCRVGSTAPWTWEVGRLEVGEEVSCELTVLATEPGVVGNTVTVEAAEPDTDPDTDTATAEITVLPAGDDDGGGSDDGGNGGDGDGGGSGDGGTDGAGDGDPPAVRAGPTPAPAAPAELPATGPSSLWLAALALPTILAGALLVGSARAPRKRSQER
jgi:uncharacterized repeat protein (TIGR01451 family)